MSEHLGYDKHDPKGKGSGNKHNLAIRLTKTLNNFILIKLGMFCNHRRQ